VSTEAKMRKKIVNIAILVIGIGLIINLSRDILRLLKAGDRQRQARTRVEELEKEQARLERQNEYYQSEDFIEQQARDKLNLAREEEIVLVLPPNVDELIESDQPQEPSALPNWQQWWQLFF
jgi:cell division protein FtsB